MLAQGLLSPVETAQARLQEQVGNFLAGRAKLLALQKHKSLEIQGQARGLYAVQVQLENQLQSEIFPILHQIKSGAWQMSDVLKIGNFTSFLVKHMNDVNKLERQAGGIPVEKSGFSYGMAIFHSVLVVLIYYFVFRKPK